MHLTYEDLERYLDTSDMSDAYIIWSEQIFKHLASCKECQEKLQRMLLISSVCDTEQIGSVLFDLEKEEDIRRELLALRLEQTAKEQKIKELAVRLRAGMLLQVAVCQAMLNQRNMTARGAKTQESMKQEQVSWKYESGKLKVFVKCEEDNEVMVIIEQKKKQKIEPIVAKAKWLPSEQMAVAEIEIGEFTEDFSVFVDVR